LARELTIAVRKSGLEDLPLPRLEADRQPRDRFRSGDNHHTPM
jgi:hypothetical protein